MRVFLRHAKTGLYRTGSNEWASEIAQALLFNTVAQAATFAFDEAVPEAEILLRCDLLDHEVSLPLLRELCDAGEPRSASD
jgi:hypothetical protein